MRQLRSPKVRVLAAASALALALTGCWSAPEQPEGTVVGFRVIDGTGEYWPGRTCEGVESVIVTVTDGEGREQTWTMNAEAGTATVDRVVVGQPPTGFSSAGASPDWPSAGGSVEVVVRGVEGPFSRATWSVSEAAEQEGTDTWLLPDGRWVGEGDVDRLAEENYHAPLCDSGR